MRFLSRLRRTPVEPAEEAGSERKASVGPSAQAVLVHLKLSDDNFGNPEEVHLITGPLDDNLLEVVDQAGIGEFDGNEIGGGWAVLYLYGPSADRIAEAVLPALLQIAPRPGSYLVRRYGGPDAPASAQSRQELIAGKPN